MAAVRTAQPVADTALASARAGVGRAPAHMAWERVVLAARTALWAGDSADESRSSAVRRDRVVAHIRQGLAAVVDTHRAPAGAAGTRRGLAAVVGEVRVSAVSVGSDPGRARRDVVGPAADLSRDHGEGAAPADLDTGRNSCLGIVAIPCCDGIPPGGNDTPLVGAGTCPQARSGSGARGRRARTFAAAGRPSTTPHVRASRAPGRPALSRPASPALHGGLPTRCTEGRNPAACVRARCWR